MKTNITDLRKSVVQILKETDDPELVKDMLFKMIDNVAQLNDELEAQIAYFSQQETNLKGYAKEPQRKPIRGAHGVDGDSELIGA